MSCRDEEGIGEWYCSPDAIAKPPNRFCPEDNRNVACKIQCLTTQESGNKVIEIEGASHLKDDGRSLQEMGEQSWLGHKQRGNNYLNLTKITGAQIFGMNELATASIPTLTLPVCVSKHNDISDRTDGYDVWNVPCTCGNDFSNETQAFFAHLGIAKGQRDFPEAKELFQRICK